PVILLNFSPLSLAFAGAIFLPGAVRAAPILTPIARRWTLPAIQSTISLDPVSLITLFFDASEKELMRRSGDMSLLSCFGLFANPTTAWSEYGILYPGQGVRYYNPNLGLQSTVEVAQVHNYITLLARGRNNMGLVVQLKPKTGRRRASLEWMVIRPLLLIVMIIVALMSLDYVALGGVAALFAGQSLVVI